MRELRLRLRDRDRRGDGEELTALELELRELGERGSEEGLDTRPLPRRRRRRSSLTGRMSLVDRAERRRRRERCWSAAGEPSVSESDARLSTAGWSPHSQTCQPVAVASPDSRAAVVRACVWCRCTLGQRPASVL